MSLLPVIAFATYVVYSVVANAIVVLVLVCRKTPLRWMRTGMPFYLFGICNHSSPPTGRTLAASALSTSIAALLAVPADRWLQGTQRPRHKEDGLVQAFAFPCAAS